MFEEINFWHLAIIPVIHNTMTSEVWLKTSLFCTGHEWSLYLLLYIRHNKNVEFLWF